MKTKNFNKKLSLKKSTIADLRNDEMTDVIGGGFSKTTVFTCIPRDSVCLICTGQCPIETEAC